MPMRTPTRTPTSPETEREAAEQAAAAPRVTDGVGRATSWGDTLESKRTHAPDGTGLAYEVVGRGSRVVLLANGLGGRLYAWAPLLEALWPRYRFITWDYRGLFESDSPENLRKLAVHHHAGDAITILDAENVERAALTGWSMGVQVSLDLAATHPERVAGMALLNGTYGHAFNTGFQPLFTVPWLPKRLHSAVELLRDHAEVARVTAKVCRRLATWPTLLMFSLTAGRKSFSMRPMLSQYFQDVMGPSFGNFLRLFQELDAHSVYHVLREIEAPALVISGLFDLLTPAYQSREIARRLPRARHMPLWRASHFALLERSEVVIPAIARFLDEEAAWA